MNWQSHITVDPQVCHGKPCIKGTRVLVSVVLANLADRETPAQIAQGYHITEEDVQASLMYAARLAEDRVVDVPSGGR